MKTTELKVGMKVYWTDPQEIYEPTAEHSSGVWVVGKTGLEDIDDIENWTGLDCEALDDIVVFCTNEAGGELECLASELKPVFTSKVIDLRKPHQKMPLPAGTQHEEGRIVH